MAALSAYYIFNLCKIVEICKNLPSPCKIPVLSIRYLSYAFLFANVQILSYICNAGNEPADAFSVGILNTISDMIKIALILVLIVAAIGIFIPEKYLPTPPKRTPLFKNWRPDDKGGLPWFGNAKRNRRRNNKYFWDD